MDYLADDYEELGPITERTPQHFDSSPTITVARAHHVDASEDTRKLSGTELDMLLAQLTPTPGSGRLG